MGSLQLPAIAIFLHFMHVRRAKYGQWTLARCYYLAIFQRCLYSWVNWNYQRHLSSLPPFEVHSISNYFAHRRQFVPKIARPAYFERPLRKNCSRTMLLWTYDIFIEVFCDCHSFSIDPQLPLDAAATNTFVIQQPIETRNKNYNANSIGNQYT